MNIRTDVRKELLGQLAKLEAKVGAVLYVRVHHCPEAPESWLADQTIYLAPGGALDVLAQAGSSMGLDQVSYAPGLNARRKVGGGLITYRFEVPAEAPLGASYAVDCGAPGQDRPRFRFQIQVS